MPYVSVHVDVEDVLPDASEAELLTELVSRRKKKGDHGSHLADYRIPALTARQALDDASRVLRKQGRTDLAFKLDEIREDYLP